MKRFGLLFAALLLAGCQGQPDAAGTVNPTPTAKFDVPDQITLAPEDTIRLRLWDRTLQVGTSADEAERFYPDARRTVQSNDLPEGFPKTYRAQVWERTDDGFGLITQSGLVAAAIATLNTADEQRLQELLRTHEELAGIPGRFVQGKHTRYWFWETRDQRLMICAFERNDRLQVTLAIGNDKVLTKLRISQSAAAADSTQVDKLLKPTDDAPPAKS